MGNGPNDQDQGPSAGPNSVSTSRTFTTEEVAIAMQVCTELVRQWCSNGTLQGVKLGDSSHWRITLGAIEELINRGRLHRVETQELAHPKPRVLTSENCLTVMLTLDQVASRVRFSTKTVSAWCSKGLLEAFRLPNSRLWRILPRGLEDLIESGGIA